MLCMTNSASAQNWQWAERAGGKGGDGGTAICLDKFGNSYVTGYFSDTASFGSFTLISPSGGNAFVAKFDAFGTILWARRIGEVSATGIGVDASGYCFVTGNFATPIFYFDTVPLLHLGGYDDIFILKLNSNGDLIWAKGAGGKNDKAGAGANALCVDQTGHFFIAGGFGDTASFGTKELVSIGASDIFVAKYDNYGTCLWAKRAGGRGDEGAQGISVDSVGNCFIAGQYNSFTLQFDSVIIVNRGSNSAFVAKYNSDGDAVWAKSGAGQSLIRAYAVASDKGGNCYATGIFDSYSAGKPDTVYIDSTMLPGGKGDIFIVKFNPDGKVEWATQAGGVSDGGFGICTDHAGNVIVTGTVGNSNPIKFDTIEFEDGAVAGDIFVAKYNMNGRVVWAKKVGGSGGDQGSAIAADANGDCYVTGYFAPNSGQNPRFDTITLSGTGARDMFIAKIGGGAPSEVSQVNIPIPQTAIYPNPSSNSSTIVLAPEQAAREFQVKVYDVLGRDLTCEFDVRFFDDIITLGRQNAPSGAYCYQILSKVYSQSLSIIGTGKFILQ